MLRKVCQEMILGQCLDLMTINCFRRFVGGTRGVGKKPLLLQRKDLLVAEGIREHPLLIQICP